MSGTNATFNVGRDVSVVVVTPLGVRLDLTGIVDFKWTAVYTDVKHQPLNQPTRQRYLPDGHNFTMTLERRGRANEDLFNAIEAGYWAGGYPNGTQDGGTVFVYTTEVDGSTTTEMGTNVTLKMSERTQAKQTTAVNQTIEGFASTKVPL